MKLYNVIVPVMDIVDAPSPERARRDLAKRLDRAGFEVYEDPTAAEITLETLDVEDQSEDSRADGGRQLRQHNSTSAGWLPSLEPDAQCRNGVHDGLCGDEACAKCVAIAQDADHMNIEPRVTLIGQGWFGVCYPDGSTYRMRLPTAAETAGMCPYNGQCEFQITFYHEH